MSPNFSTMSVNASACTVSLPIQPTYIFPPQAGSPQVKRFGEMIAGEFGLAPQLGELMHHRGVQTLDAAQEFLYPQLSMLPSPATMKGMVQATAVILEAWKTRQTIFIHGDYDVDGITATALLIAFFREIGISAVFYIPNRLEERYGLSVSSINRLLAQADGARGGVLITVDCGVSAVQEVAYARSQGLRVIVTDHHEPQAVLPEAEAVLDPKQRDCGFPFAQLSGVGVAFFLVMALRKAFAEQGLPGAAALNLKKYLDLTALGTVADVVPLIGVNRILVRAGLEVLSAQNRLGLRFLCECCSLADREILAEDIAYKLAPRINAAGRLGFPRLGVELLLAEDRDRAGQLAAELERMNAERKQLEQQSLAAIEEQCAQQINAGRDGLAVYQAQCHPGVLGILASRIADRFNRPTIIFTDEHEGDGTARLKGSGRSVTGVHLFQVLEQCAPLLEQFGGHAMAGGLTIDKASLESFADHFNRQVALYSAVFTQTRGIDIDCYLADKSLLNKKFARALQMLQPFGEGNLEPTFLLSGAKLAQPMGVNGHLRFQLRVSDQELFPGIGFRLANDTQDFQAPLDLVFHLKRSWFRGTERDQVQALHLIPL